MFSSSPSNRTLERRDLSLRVGRALLEGFDLITGMIGSDDSSKRGSIEEAEFVDGEESRSIVLFPVPGGSDGVCGTEWTVFVVTWGMRTGMGAIGSEWRSKLRQPASVTLYLDFESIIRLLSIGLLSLQTNDSFVSRQCPSRAWP